MSRPPSSEERARIDEQLDLLARARALSPGRLVPYHAHVRLLREGGRQSDVLLGSGMRAGEGLAIIDWRTAPLSEVFFGCAEGDEYEVDLGDRRLAGLVLQRNLVSYDDGELVEIETPRAVLCRRGAGGWMALPPRRLPGLHPRPPAARKRLLSPAEVDLDPAQRAVVAMAPGEAVLILGEAGCGKTTVALHRLRRLSELAGRKLKAAVIVPSEGLRRLCESLLERLGLEDVEALTYDRFAAQQARRSFVDLPRRESQNASAATIALKRHEALRVALRLLAEKKAALPEEGREVRRTRALARRDDLHALFGDRALLDAVVAAAKGTLTANAAIEAAEHARVQFSETAEEQYAHVDRDSRMTADERGLDEGTPTEDAQTIDVEDYAVLFELERLRAEAAGARPMAPKPYDCIVVDEAQELAPLELALVGRSVAQGGTLIVAGDAAQQVDEDACFRGWPQAMAELFAPVHATAVLEVSYRCPPEVTSFARALREPAALVPAPAEARSLSFQRFGHESHLAAWLIEALRTLDGADPSATCAVIARSAAAAAGFAMVLRHGLPVHLALEGRFDFRPGTQVTSVQEVKGLEFDYVVVPDATEARYPDTPESRRALYVAATRACEQLILVAAGELSPLCGE